MCGEELPELHFAECMACLQPYHMRMTETDRSAKDCGLAFVDSEDVGVVFLCHPCFDREQES